MTFQIHIDSSGFEEILADEARQIGLYLIDCPYQATRFWASGDRMHGAALDPNHQKFFLWHRAFGSYRSDWLDADAVYQ
jgi:hypothetical protein